jgi:tetratricopeptide (TPR) repeat protein
MDILKKSLCLALITIITTAGAYSQQEKLSNAFSQSYAFEASGEYVKATEALKAVYDANSYEINLRLGWLTYSTGSFTDSRAYYTKAVSLMPNSIEAKLGLVLPLAAAGKWDDVIVQYKNILEIDPKNSLVNYRMGSIYYSREDYNSALKYLETGITLYPFDYDFLVLLAWTNYKLGKKEQAKVLFQKALLNKPTDKSAKEGLELVK